MAAQPSAVRCPDCGSDMSEPGLPGLCPQCLLSLALRESPASAGLDAGQRSDNLGRDSPGGSNSDALATLDRLQAGRILGERYQIRELLGRGGMGEVFRAFDLKLRVDVALKAVRAEKVESERARELLRREVRSAREVVSPNVCRIFDLVAEDGQELVSMEYVDGETLGDVLRQRGPLALHEAREIAAQFLSGLDAIHQAGLVHRDFKPENVMLTRAGRVVVMDFGLAKAPTTGRTGTISGTPAYMAPEQMRGDPADARADVFAAAVVLAEMLCVAGSTGRGDERFVAGGGGAASVGGAALGAGPSSETSGGVAAVSREELWRAVRETPPRLPDSPWAPVLRQSLSPDPGERHATARALARALEEVTQRLPGFETKRPYPGLSSFTEEDAEYFFGREQEVEALLKKLRRPRLLALVAPSGAGKSSFLRAGLLPALPKGWKPLVATPGSRPFQALAQALAPAFAGDAQAMQSLLRYEEPDVALGLFQRFRQRHEHALVIVDQFEELFTLSPREVRQAFSELLGRLVLEADLHVILSLRDDFLFRCRDHEALVPVFSELTPLARLDASALRRALVQPALACGYRFEDEALVDEMTGEVQKERGALPLLAFAASRLWERRDREQGLLTRAAYLENGGVAGALARHAEDTLERIGAERMPTVRELFRNLVTAEGTRAVRARDELLSVFAESAGIEHREHEPPGSASDSVRTEAGQPAATVGAGTRADAESVLAALLDARLLTSYERSGEGGESHHQVEIVHESLLEAWPRLVRWRAQDQDGALLRDQLRQAAQLWDEKGRNAELLWSGTAYEEFRLWRERYAGSLSAIESDYARAMAERARRRRLRLRLAVASAFVVVTSAAVVIGWSRQEAVKARDQARSEAARAEASRLLAIAELRLRDDPTEALAFATASLARADSTEARVFAMKALWQAPPALELRDAARGAASLAFSPDGRTLAVPGFSSDVVVWSEGGGGPLKLPGHETDPRGGNTAGWASDELLVTGAAGNAGSRVHLWAMPEGRRIRTIDFGAPSWWQVGSRRLLVETSAHSGDPFLLRSWGLPDGEPQILGRDVSAPGSTWTFFTPDASRWLYSKGRDIYARRLPIAPGGDRPFGRLDAEPAGAQIWKDPDRLFVADRTGRTHVWPLGSHGAVAARTIAKPAAATPPVMAERSGRWVFEAVRDPELRLWRTAEWPAARPLTLRRNRPWQQARTTFHPSGDWVVVGGMEGGLTFWPLRRPYPTVVDVDASRVTRPVAFSPDGRWLVASAGGRLCLWPVSDRGGREARSLDPSAGARWGTLAFDPRGRYLFGIHLGGAWLIPLDGSAARPLEGNSSSTNFNTVAVSPGGRRVAAVTYYGRDIVPLRVWDVDTGAMWSFSFDDGPAPRAGQGRIGSEGGASHVAFADEDTLYTAGPGGLRRWNLSSGTQEIVVRAASGYSLLASFSAGARVALTAERRLEGTGPDCREARLHDLTKGRSQPLTAFGSCSEWRGVAQLDPSGTIAVSGTVDGIVRVGKLDGGEPHLLLGHRGLVDRMAISPDRRWVATTGQDNTLRLWPMPDLSKPPLHTLPRAELIAKLHSLTNIRVELDSSAPEGWRLEVGPFPGWKTVPEW